MKKQNIFLFIGLLSASFLSCEKPLDKDQTNPVVSAFNINGSAESIIVDKGSVLNIQVQFQDDKELQKYRVRVLDKFFGSIKGEPFSFEEVKPLVGKQASIALQIQIPDTVLAGHFEVVVDAMDKEDNISIPAKIKLQITQPILPKIGVNLGATNFFNGDTIHLSGFITISTDLDLIYFNIAENQLLEERIFEDLFSLTEDVITTWSVGNLTTEKRPLVVPSNAKRGKYLVNIAAYDSIGNMSLKTFDIYVSERETIGF